MKGLGGFHGSLGFWDSGFWSCGVGGGFCEVKGCSEGALHRTSEDSVGTVGVSIGLPSRCSFEALNPTES